MHTRIQIAAAMFVEHSMPAFLLFFGSAFMEKNKQCSFYAERYYAAECIRSRWRGRIKTFYLSRSASTSYILGRSVARKAEPGCIFTVTAHDQFRETDKELLLPEPLNTPCRTWSRESNHLVESPAAERQPSLYCLQRKTPPPSCRPVSEEEEEARCQPVLLLHEVVVEKPRVSFFFPPRDEINVEVIRGESR